MKNNFKQILQKSLLAVFVVTIVTACKKEKEPVATGKIYPSVIQVGITDPAKFDVVSMEPSTLLGWSYSTSVSLNADFTGDNVPDIRFNVSNQDIQGNLTEDGHSNATLNIETLTSDFYILTDSSYIVPFDQGTSISTNDHWNQGVLTLLNRTYTCCPATPHVYEGLWDNKTGHYVGIRYKNRLGWLKVGVIYNCYIKVYGYAWSK